MYDVRRPVDVDARRMYIHMDGSATADRFQVTTIKYVVYIRVDTTRVYRGELGLRAAYLRVDRLCVRSSSSESPRCYNTCNTAYAAES